MDNKNKSVKNILSRVLHLLEEILSFITSEKTMSCLVQNRTKITYCWLYQRNITEPSTIALAQYFVTTICPWVKVFRIVPEFRILRLTFHRKSA